MRGVSSVDGTANLMRPFSTKSVPSVDTMTLTRGAGISGQPTKLIEVAMEPPERLSRGADVPDVHKHTVTIAGDPRLQERDACADQWQAGCHGVEECTRGVFLRWHE